MDTGPTPCVSPTSTDSARQPARGARFSLSTRVLFGFLAGIAAGLIAGEACAPLGILGDIFVGLLQMTVLPYIVVSLIVNLGQLSVSACRQLVTVAFGVLAALWLLAAIVVMVLPLALPDWQAGSFFSAGLLDTPAQIDVLELFVPTNPFEALANNVVPAAVVFSLFVGIGLIGVENKQPLLDNLRVLLKALGRVNQFVASFSPFGVFAIVAEAAGTISLDEFTRLQAYLLIYAAGIVLLALLILPLLVASTTSISYLAFLRVAWGPMLTAFATGKIFVVLPLIAEGSAKLLRESGAEGRAAVEPEALVSLGYPFPHLGKLIGLLFIPFTAWFVGSPMAWIDYPGFLGAGLVTMFGSPLASVPFLLNSQQLPADMFQMFVASGVICGRAGDLLGVIHLFAFTLLTTCLLEGRVRVRAGGMILFGLAATASIVLSVATLRLVLSPIVRQLPAKEGVLLNMHSAVVPMDHVEYSAPPPAERLEQDRTRLERIRQRGALRVGFLPDNLPFSFRNQAGQLVGFDIDMAHLLASELGCQLWLIPLRTEQVLDELDRGTIDLVMSGIGMTTDRLEAATFTRPYLRVTMSLVVRDYRRREFSDFADIRNMSQLRIATPPSRRFTEALQRLCPHAEIVTVQSPREFFEDPDLRADALLISAEAGAAWTLMHPGYTPVVPQPGQYQLPLAYPVAQRDAVFADFMSQWIELKSGTPDFRRLYDYWILGQDPQPKRPRWCILRDVLGWIR